MKKTVYIAHPVGGDVKNNAKKILKICHRVHTRRTIPVAPYLVSIQYLNDDFKRDRQLGIDANLEYFKRKIIDEVWLFGPKISTGMREEIILARKLGIPVVPKTKETKKEYKKLFP